MNKEDIIKANIELHKKEAVLYDQIHPELINSEESLRLDKFLAEAYRPKIKYTLDIGAGTGFVAQKLLKAGFVVSAIDISAEMLDMLKQKLGANTSLFIQTADADSFLDTTTTKYGLIAGSSVLHHLPDYTQTIQKMIQHLGVGGYLLFFHEPTGHKASKFEEFLRKIDFKLYRIILFYRGILSKLKSAQLDYTMADYHVTHGFDENKVVDILKANNLEIIKIERYTTAQTWIMRKIFKLCFPASTWSLLAKKALPLTPSPYQGEGQG